MSWTNRCTLIVDRSLQYRFFATALFHFVIILVVIIGAIFLPLSLQLNDSSLSWAERNAITQEFLSLHTRVWPPTLIALIFITLHWAIFSHRIAGPLYRFRKVFQEISEGNLSVHATIRKKDCLKNEALALDNMILCLRSRIQELEQQQQDVRAAFEEMKRCTTKEQNPALHQKILSLGTQIEIGQILLESFNMTASQKTSDRNPSLYDDLSTTHPPVLASSATDNS